MMRENDLPQEEDVLLINEQQDIVADKLTDTDTLWYKASHRVLLGLILTTFTLNFALLNYILPAIGNILLLLGFRTLRRENHWFGYCWGLTIAEAVYFFSTLILNSMIIQSEIYAVYGGIFVAIAVVLTLARFFCLWEGLRAVQQEVELSVHAGAVTALGAWYVILMLLAAGQVVGWLIVIVMLIAYFYIFRKLYRLVDEINAIGYMVEEVPVRLTNTKLTAVILLITGIGMAYGYLFGSSYDMDWKPVIQQSSVETEEVKAHLVSLGFPENVLADLTEEDILSCADAKRIVGEVSDWDIDKKQRMESSLARERVTEGYDLRLTNIAVELPGEQEQWKVIHHFRWIDTTHFYGTEAIQLWPAWRGNSGFRWKNADEITGCVYYEKDEQSYTAPYYFLGEDSYISNNFMWGPQANTDIFATFSFPRTSENQRGYMSYVTELIDRGGLLNSWVNYVHQNLGLQYPAKTAMEHRKQNNFYDGMFVTVQEALQYDSLNPHHYEDDYEFEY